MSAETPCQEMHVPSERASEPVIEWIAHAGIVSVTHHRHRRYTGGRAHNHSLREAHEVHISVQDAHRGDSNMSETFLAFEPVLGPPVCCLCTFLLAGAVPHCRCVSVSSVSLNLVWSIPKNILLPVGNVPNYCGGRESHPSKEGKRWLSLLW